MADSGMNIVGFVPNPETAATVVAWTQALADKDEGRIFLCYETGFDGRTAQAVHEALGEEGDSVATVTRPSTTRCPWRWFWATCARETAVSS